MERMTELALPAGIDWQHWCERWERMQERYLVRRNERFSVITALIRATQPRVRCVLDLGCGSGSTMQSILDAFPYATVIGIDVDPTLLSLANARLATYGERLQFIRADLRQPDWRIEIAEPVDAIVSATALHWLSKEQLANLYRQLPDLLWSGGLFVNADHLPSESPAIQEYWQQHRELMRADEGHQDAEDWRQYWNAFSTLFDPAIIEERTVALGMYEGQEMPLAWHLDRLRESGFTAVDCFWRCDCDAIYGGIYV